jgi:hypothetical protein
MNLLQGILFGLAWPAAIGVALTLWANRATMFPMQWHKEHLGEVWKIELPDLDGVATITVGTPHEAEVHFGSGDNIHIETIGTFRRWDDAARMTEQFITALREEVQREVQRVS